MSDDDALLMFTPAAMQKYGHRCIYCGRPDGLECHPIEPSAPITLDNILVCCEPCDGDRGGRSHAEYLTTDVATTLGIDPETL